MSKIGFVLRYAAIIRLLRSNAYISTEDLIKGVEESIAYYDDDDRIAVGERTIKRDLSDLDKYLGLKIPYSRVNNGYYLPEDESLSDVDGIMVALNLFELYYNTKHLPMFVYSESKSVQGTEHLSRLLRAIRKCQQVHFYYQRFDNSAGGIRKVEPYALKEFRGRWYLLSKEVDGKPEEKGHLKTWGLDRIRDLEVTNIIFEKDSNFSIEQSFKDYFGIYSRKDIETEEVILSLDPVGGQYLETLPLHPSQETIFSNEEEVQVRLQVKITSDFIMELLSKTQNITVVKPDHLRKGISDIYTKALTRYKNS